MTHRVDITTHTPDTQSGYYNSHTGHTEWILQLTDMTHRADITAHTHDTQSGYYSSHT